MADTDEAEVLQLLIDRAEHRIDLQLQADDALDAKALGLLGGCAAAIALVVVVRDSMGTHWWIPAVILGVSTILFVVVTWPRQYDHGPDLKAFYLLHGRKPLEDARRQMLAELVAAGDTNAGVFPAKSTFYRASCALLALGLVGALLAVLIEGYSGDDDGRKRRDHHAVSASASSRASASVGAGPAPPSERSTRVR